MLTPPQLPPTMGDIFQQPEEEIGKLTFLNRLWQYFAALPKTILNTLGDYCGPDSRVRFYLEAITNTFNQFSPSRGAKLEK